MDIKKFTLPHAIRMDDYCYFLFAVEARQPFWTIELLNLGIESREKYMIRKGYSKFILRQVVRDYIPINRRLDKKVGLNLPFDSWIKNELRYWVANNLEKRTIQFLTMHLLNLQNQSYLSICQISKIFIKTLGFVFAKSMVNKESRIYFK